MYAVIMAGGSGTRLWPLSRASRPKQLLHLIGGKSLLRIAYERVAPVAEPDNTYVIAIKQHLPQIAAEIPELPAENLIGEPEGRDTANAVALSAALLQRKDAGQVMAVLTADHWITPVDAFRDALRRASEVITQHRQTMVALSIPAKRPETAFGYVRRGRRIDDQLYEVDRFTEKPDADRARAYVESDEYDWNSGNFLWRVDTILSQLRQHLPATYDGVMRIAEHWNTSKRDPIATEVYTRLEPISIDYAVMEKADQVLAVQMNCDWADVGSWRQLDHLLATQNADADSNVAVTANSLYLDSQCNLTVSGETDHLIAAMGAENLIIVHTPDATLVCHKDHAHRLKELVARVREQHGDTYL